MKVGIICAGDEELAPFLPLIENCKITSKSTKLGAEVLGIGSNGNSVITNCHIEADGFSDTDTDGDGTVDVVRVYAVVSSANSDIIINGGYYWGARDALGIVGAARINGGIYEGCQHGGGYMEGSDIMVKNATFRCVEYKGEVGWKDNFHGGAVYCGSSVNNVNVSFDHCRFESNCHATSGVVAKYTGTEVLLSNCVIDGDFDYDLRADAGNTIYVGKNVSYETVYENGGTIDTTTYADHEFGFETETVIPTARLAVKDERGNWIAIA